MYFPFGDKMYYMMFIAIRWLNGREWESKTLFHHLVDKEHVLIL